MSVHALGPKTSKPVGFIGITDCHAAKQHQLIVDGELVTNKATVGGLGFLRATADARLSQKKHDTLKIHP